MSVNAAYAYNMEELFGRYWEEYFEGRSSTDNAQCPYGEDEIGKHCAWIGGKNDVRSE